MNELSNYFYEFSHIIHTIVRATNTEYIWIPNMNLIKEHEKKYSINEFNTLNGNCRIKKYNLKIVP